jgi:hypothetical protein
MKWNCFLKAASMTPQTRSHRLSASYAGSGILQTDAEALAAEEDVVRHRPQRRLKSLYPC